MTLALPSSSPLVVRDSIRQVEGYLTWLSVVKRRQPRTVKDYRSRLGGMLESFAHRPLTEVDALDVEEWFCRPTTHGQPPSPVSMSKNRTVALGLFRWLVATGQVNSNPVELTGCPTIHNEQPKPIPDEEWLKLWGWATTTDVEATAILTLGAFGGLRRFEIANLSPQHLKAGDDLSIVNFLRKGGSRDTLPLGKMLDIFATCQPHLLRDPSAAREALQTMKARGGHHLVFNEGSRWLQPADRVASLNGALTKWARNAGCSRKLTPHMMRHSTATWLLRSGVPLHMTQRLMNHSDPKTTMRYTKTAGSKDLEEWLDIRRQMRKDR